MIITIVDYNEGKTHFIHSDEELSEEEVIYFISKHFNLDEIYYMTTEDLKFAYEEINDYEEN